MKTLKSLHELKSDQSAQIIGFSEKLSPSYLARLRELGFREGEYITCLKRPPLGAPRVFQVNGCVFSVESEIACECQIEISTH